MLGLGAPELLVILAIVALLFGPAVVAFVAGYALGQRKASAPAAPSEPPASPETPAPSKPPVPTEPAAVSVEPPDTEHSESENPHV